jgi:phage terminase large subunit GpA-like protein
VALAEQHPLLDEVARNIANGLRRKSISTCGRWAEEYRIMGAPIKGKWSFLHHPWLRGMHDCSSERMFGQKSAQMGFTETALNKAFYWIDVKGASVLYLLPASKPDASDFSTSRFDPALELSEHLSGLFENVKNIGHKRAGSANLFIRGSRSRSSVKSIPVSLLIADEVDEMHSDNLVLAFERTSGQIEKQIFLLSTPTIKEAGINRFYLTSTQEHFFFRCPCCSKMTELVFPDCIVITAEEVTDNKIRDTHLICKECKGVLKHEEKKIWLADGTWVEGYSNRHDRGFYVNQLYSNMVEPWELAEQFIKAQVNPADEQEFWNSKMGMPHEVAHARLSDDDLGNCIQPYRLAQEAPLGAFCTMGVDVGKVLHVEIDQWFFDDNLETTDIN